MSAADDPLVGREIANGRYLVVDVLGRGGMGTVYTALQRPVDRKVALKIIHRELAGNPEIVARFLEEMRLTATIEHPHTVRVYDFGEIDGQPFLTTELLAGRSLRDELLRAGPLPQERVASICAQIAKALRAAQAHGVVHRDLKPENIMLLDLDGESDYVKVLDFGIARSLHRTTGMRTGTGALLGTPAYMSPEQCEGKRVDGRSDLYALGLIAYELASGTLPFPPSESLPQMLLSHVATPPPDLAARAPQLSAPMTALIMRLLAKAPDQRPPSAEAVIAALEPFLPAKRPSAAATTAMAATEVGTGAAPLPPPAAATSPARRSSRRRLWLPIAALVAAGGIGGLLWRRHPSPQDADPESEAQLHVARARTASLAGQDEVAEKELREALRLLPGSKVALFNLAVVLLKRERPAEALPLLDVILRDDPAHAAAHLVRGQARLKTGDPRGAREDLEQQAKLSPDSRPAWLLLAEARRALGDEEGARQAQARAATAGAR
ncbi:MAG TPA: protein kinase [Polyangia bacterium]|nr:protein kinase [Polyangia bacterium]